MLEIFRQGSNNIKLYLGGTLEPKDKNYFGVILVLENRKIRRFRKIGCFHGEKKAKCNYWKSNAILSPWHTTLFFLKFVVSGRMFH